MALAFRKEAIENLTVDGERFDLGTLGPDRAVVGFRGTAILVVGGVSLKWISGCAQPSLRRLHFVGEVMRGVTGQIPVGMPARSEGSRVGKGCVSTCRSRGSPSNYK